ncbi:hypothetical protein NPIL_414351 [Nephila pilipes]|uniref:Uncharacterized protein n=1 Tax=Nephila pilipes TaxID=299642 RepID=A0A8X6TGA3_NEPPI|nr:hypothetical protein NPIL_414351 [Nephila pilipes]
MRILQDKYKDTKVRLRNLYSINKNLVYWYSFMLFEHKRHSLLKEFRDWRHLSSRYAPAGKLSRGAKSVSEMERDGKKNLKSENPIDDYVLNSINNMK